MFIETTTVIDRELTEEEFYIVHNARASYHLFENYSESGDVVARLPTIIHRANLKVTGKGLDREASEDTLLPLIRTLRAQSPAVGAKRLRLEFPLNVFTAPGADYLETHIKVPTWIEPDGVHFMSKSLTTEQYYATIRSPGDSLIVHKDKLGAFLGSISELVLGIEHEAVYEDDDVEMDGWGSVS